MRLWSTVVIQDAAGVTHAALIAGGSLEGHQVGGDRAGLGVREAQRRHLHARLDRAWVLHPGGHGLGRVREHSGGERLAAPERGEVGAEHAGRHAADRVAADTGAARADGLARPGRAGRPGRRSGPRTSTPSAPAAGAACVRKMTWIVGIAIRSSTSAGAIVQESSSSVWPRVCGGGGAPGLSRKRNSTHASPAKTTRAMTAATHVMIPYTWRISRAKSERAAPVLMGPSHAQPPGRRAAAASPRRTWAHSLVCPFTRLEPTGAPGAPQGEARRRARAARAAARSPPARSPPSRSSRPRGGSGHPWTE